MIKGIHLPTNQIKIYLKLHEAFMLNFQTLNN